MRAQISPKLLLASGSPRRIELLKTLKIPFIAKTPAVTELADPRASPEYLAQYNANLKAEFYDFEHFVLGADTIVVLENTILGKPKNLTEAASHLQQLSGRWHNVLTAISLINKQQNYSFQTIVKSSVKFKPLTDKIIQEYIENTHPLDKAGAYGIQDHSGLIIDTYQGSLNNIIGLPTEMLSIIFQKLKII